LYYKACAKHVPVLLCTTKLAQRKLLHTASSFAEKLLHTESFLNREAFTHRSFYTQQAFTQRSFYTHTNTQQAFTEKSFYAEKFSGIAAPKLDLGAKAKQNTILKHFSKGILQGKLLASAKIQKSAGKSLSQP